MSSSSSISSSSSLITNSTPVEPATSYSAPKRPTGSGMKLGSKKKDLNQFVDKLASEGVTVEEIPTAASRKTAAAKVSAIPEVDKERLVVKSILVIILICLFTHVTFSGNISNTCGMTIT